MQPAVRWRHVEARSSCLNGKSGHGRLNAVTLAKANFWRLATPNNGNALHYSTT
jgi:hypothetical protein